MKAGTRNRLLLLGALWGLVLAAVPAVVMTDPLRLTGLLVAALLCAMASGAVGTLVAGRRVVRTTAARNGGGRLGWLRVVRIGTLQGLVGGSVAALLLWVVMSVVISGFTPSDPVDPSVLTSPRVFLGSFFVALSAFLYALTGGLLLGPLVGPLVERIVGNAAHDNDSAKRKERSIVR